MTGRRTLALFSAPSCEGIDALEFFRVVAALVACGHPVELVLAGEGASALASDDVPDEVDRYLESLAAVGVTPRSLASSELVHAAGTSAALLRFADPSRRAEPLLLELTSRATADGEAQLVEAGQVISTRSADA